MFKSLSVSNIKNYRIKYCRIKSRNGEFFIDKKNFLYKKRENELRLFMDPARERLFPALWNIDAERKPTDETICHEVLQHLLENPEWIKAGDAASIGALVRKTKPQDPATQKVHRAVLDANPWLFEQITVKFEGTDKVEVPKLYLMK